MHSSPLTSTGWARYLPLVLLALTIINFVIVYFQPQWHDVLRYQRESFSSAFSTSLWQGLGHAFVHLNQQHLALNALALLCIYLLFPNVFSSWMWVLVFFGSALVSSIGLFLYSPDVGWCVGASGALHGLMVYAMLRARASIVWLLAMLGKIVIEQLDLLEKLGWPNLTGDFIQHNIVVDAHLWGAIGGLAFFALAQSVYFIRIVKEVNAEQ